MDIINASLLALSIFLSAGRNILSKGISDTKFGSRPYFIMQTVTFAAGAILVFVLNPNAFTALASTTVIYGAFYAVLMLAAQWCYLGALTSGAVSVCATMYSMGFIIPTLAGMLVWDEKATLIKVIGILVIIPVIILAGAKEKDTSNKKGFGYIIPLTAALVSSGFMGIVQKLLSLSKNPEQTPAFIILALFISAVTSLLCAIVSHGNVSNDMMKKLVFSSGVGICFSGYNFINTYLTARLDSSILFPVLNIGIIIISMVLSVILFKEKLDKRKCAILSLGVLSILLITL